MPNVNQISALLNSVTAQAYGSSPIVVSDLSGLISLGDFVLNSGNDDSKDKFLNTLVDRIGRVIISMRPYKAKDFGLMMNVMDYGCILQKITTMPMTASNAIQWEIEDGESYDPWTVSKPKVVQKLFNGINAWKTKVSIPDYQLYTAFLSFENMAAFIDSVFMSMANSFEFQIETTARMAVGNFIGEKIVAQNAAPTTVQAVYLVQAYNTRFGKTLTAAECWSNMDFLKYATARINLTVKYFRDMSTAFNSENFTRFTPEEYVRISMLTEFATAAQYYLQSDTFHNDLVQMPNYREINYWQGTADAGVSAYDAKTLSSINITTSSGTTVKQDGIVALITDIEAIGMTVDRRRMLSSPPNPESEVTNYYHKADVMYYNDLSENGVVFIVTDTPYTSPATPDENTVTVSSKSKKIATA